MKGFDEGILDITYEVMQGFGLLDLGRDLDSLSSIPLLRLVKVNIKGSCNK